MTGWLANPYWLAGQLSHIRTWSETRTATESRSTFLRTDRALQARLRYSISARIAATPACTDGPKSRSCSVSIRIETPSAIEKRTSATASAGAWSRRTPSACFAASSPATWSRVRRRSSANSAAIS